MIEKGQIWRRRKSGKLVRVTQAHNLSSAGNAPYHDVHWETVDKPYRRGTSYEDYWVKNCELVREAADAVQEGVEWGIEWEGKSLPLDHDVEMTRRTAQSALGEALDYGADPETTFIITRQVGPWRRVGESAPEDDGDEEQERWAATVAPDSEA